MKDIGLYFCSSGSRMEMGIPGPRGALWEAGGIREDKRARKNHEKIGLYFGGKAEETKLREDLPLSRPSGHSPCMLFYLGDDRIGECFHLHCFIHP